jgi:hypothetical protein
VILEERKRKMGDYLRVPAGEPVPLSVLALDLDPPVAGWDHYLSECGVEIINDDLGRRSVRRADAARLLREQAAARQRAYEMAEANERAAIEADKRWRAQLHPGVPWHQMPDPGLLPVVQMTAAGRAAEPRRTPTQTEWLFGEADTMVYHEFPAEDE